MNIVESEVLAPGQVSRILTSESVADLGHVHQHLARFVVSYPLEEVSLAFLKEPEILENDLVLTSGCQVRQEKIKVLLTNMVHMVMSERRQ